MKTGKSLFVVAMEELVQLEKVHGRDAVEEFINIECREAALQVDAAILGIPVEDLRKQRDDRGDDAEPEWTIKLVKREE